MNNHAIHSGPLLQIAFALLAALALVGSAIAQTPNPQSANTGCPDNYGITVRGTNFDSNAYIDVRRAGDWGSVIDQFSGSQLQRSTEGGQNVLRFTVSNSSTRSTLNSPGLWLWVVNPSAGTWTGPVSVTRTAPSTPGELSGQLNSYTVSLSGSNVAGDAYVDVRSSTGGSVLASYSGAQLTRGCSGDQTTLSFNITDPAQRSHLGSGGLNFWVVNSSAGAWNGPVHLQGAATNQPPTASLSVSPTTGLVAPAAVTMSVSAYDSDGSISRVEFYRNGSLVGTDYSAPYSHYLTGLAAGSHGLSARAYDNLDANSNSNAVNISVGTGGGTPSLMEARTVGIDNYSVRLQGTSFPPDAHVDVRAGSSGAVVATYSGSQLTRSNSGGYNYLTFTITDASNRSRLDSQGLYFWVVNPSAGTWSSSAYAKRRIEARGGSNYNWYNVDFNADGSCNREPYGVVKNYHGTTATGATVRATVQSQLASMYSSGQRRLRIGLFFGRGFETGTVVNAAGGNFPSWYLTNLRNLLIDARKAGFQEVVVGLFPQGADYIWWNHTSYRSDIHAEYARLIDQAYTTTASAGIAFYFDLANEMFPPSGREPWSTFAKNLWTQFADTHGVANSVGFSVPLASSTEPNDRLANIARIYGSRLPPVLDLHMYFSGSEGSLLRTADTVLDGQNLRHIPIMIGEVHYDDASVAASLGAVARDTSVDRKIMYLLQWPKSRTASQHASCDGQNVQSPLNAFGAFIGESF